MFLTFTSNEERRNYGGSAFLEIQYCQMPASTPVQKLVSARAVRNWELSSLYVCSDDLDAFYREYHSILRDGVYNNMGEGGLDLYGVNYYDQAKTRKIIEALKKLKSKESQTFLRWLMDPKNVNGFYVLGI